MKRQSSHQKAPAVSQPQVPAADAKAQHQPGQEGAQEKQEVRKGGIPGPQGTQKIVEQPQAQPQNAGGQEPGGGKSRRRQPKSLFVQLPPLRGSL